MRLLATVLVALLSLAACSRERERRFPIEGQILAIDAVRNEITLRHEDVKGFMPAMTMPFAVVDVKGMSGRKPGDLIRATLVVAESTGRLENIVKVGEAPLPPDAPEDARVPMLEPGADAPDGSFVDQDGRERRLSDWHGKTVAVTFVYTRCPVPNFCPLMDKHFGAVQRVVKDDAALRGRVRLVSVSFDPEFDTPQVLRQHAKQVGADPEIWTWLTGERRAVHDFVASFGVSTINDAQVPQQIVHNLRTAVIDRHGKIASILSGNDWTPETLVTNLRTADGR
jgi:protein SCO1